MATQVEIMKNDTSAWRGFGGMIILLMFMLTTSATAQQFNLLKDYCTDSQTVGTTFVYQQRVVESRVSVNGFMVFESSSYKSTELVLGVNASLRLNDKRKLTYMVNNIGEQFVLLQTSLFKQKAINCNFFTGIKVKQGVWVKSSPLVGLNFSINLKRIGN